MLYITLNKGDYVVVGDNIRVFYEKPNGDKGFMIGIDAPKDVPILRRDLYERLLAERSGEEAVQALAEDHYERRKRNTSSKVGRRYGARMRREQKLVSEIPAES